MNAHRARKRFGQHFLTDPGAIDAIISAIRPAANDLMIEIGPGRGAITKPLSRALDHLHVVELDRDLAEILRKNSGEALTVHEADALSFDFTALSQRFGGELRVVGNLPYNISTPLLFRLLEQRDAIADMHFMLQKEVVDRMAAPPGSKTYGRLSIMLGCFFHIESLFDVEPAAFEPPPAVMSAVVRLMPKGANTPAIDDLSLLSRVVATAFSQRRKTLRNALKNVANDEDFEMLSIDASARPEQLSIADWVALANHLHRHDTAQGSR